MFTIFNVLGFSSMSNLKRENYENIKTYFVIFPYVT
jgi:hypothetical protein